MDGAGRARPGAVSGHGRGQRHPRLLLRRWRVVRSRGRRPPWPGARRAGRRHRRRGRRVHPAGRREGPAGRGAPAGRAGHPGPRPAGRDGQRRHDAGRGGRGRRGRRRHPGQRRERRPGRSGDAPRGGRRRCPLCRDALARPQPRDGGPGRLLRRGDRGRRGASRTGRHRARRGRVRAADRGRPRPRLRQARRAELAAARRHRQLGELGFPIIIGASRKRFLGRLLAGADGAPRPFGRSDDATLAVTALAAHAGAWCVRVHHVGPNADAVRVAAAWRAGEEVR